MTSATADSYREFLRTRDGEPDFLRRTLSRRETFFDHLTREPLAAAFRVDRATWLRNLGRRHPEPGLDARTLWLLATAKANQAERFGVGLAEVYGRIQVDGDPVRVHIMLQEVYHTRLLADVVAMFGLPVYARPPAFIARSIVRIIVAVPEEWHLPLTGAAEMVGCVIFRTLRDRGVALFADDPAIAARIRLLYDEILGDEIGHVGHIASRLGRSGRATMQGLFRVLGMRMATTLPELVALVGRAALALQFRAFHLGAMAAELPGIAYAAAT